MSNRGKFSGNRLSDRDMLLDLLATEKYMSHLYDHAIMEASGDTVRDTFMALQQDEHEIAQTLFDFMRQQGWYTTGGNRQQADRRLKNGQRLSGGMRQSQAGGAMDYRADSRYAVTSGARRFGQSLTGGGPANQGGRQPAWAGQGKHGRFDERSY